MNHDADHDTVSRRCFVQIMPAAAACAFGLIPAAVQAGSNSPHVIALEIQKREVPSIRNRTVRVTEGDDVRIDWTTDEAAELHLHGYDIEVRAKPGRTVSMAFRAKTAGRFPVSAHNFGHRILIYLEVYPR